MARNLIRCSVFALATLVLATCSKKDSGTNSQPAAPTPTALVVVSGNNQTGTVNQELVAALVVQVNDQFGSAMANARGAGTLTARRTLGSRVDSLNGSTARAQASRWRAGPP